MSMKMSQTQVNPPVQNIADTVKDSTENRKRQLSENAEPTGETPEAKRPTMSDTLRLEMPSDDAPTLVWLKALFTQMMTMCDHYDELKTSLEFSQKEITDYKNKIGNMAVEIGALKSEVGYLQCENQDLKVQYTALAEKQIKTEVHLREKNLVFEGIVETYGEDSQMLYGKLVNVLNHIMAFNGNAGRMLISKVHRVGPYIKGQVRPVVCHFVQHGDIQFIMKNRSQLPNNIFVHDNFPPEIDNRRRILRPIFNKAKKMDKYKGKCRLVQDKLIIEGKSFTVEPINNLNQLPKTLHPRSVAEKQTDDVIVFFSKGSPFSNFHFSPFVKDNVKYCCNEQFIQAKKAQLFNDDLSQSKIMKSMDPYLIKKLGKGVKDFIQQRWEREAKQIALDGCLAKFTQNKDLLDALLETDRKTIGEASRDSLWGIGMSLDDPKVLDSSAWSGENLLGNILTYVREQLQD